MQNDEVDQHYRQWLEEDEEDFEGEEDGIDFEGDSEDEYMLPDNYNLNPDHDVNEESDVEDGAEVEADDDQADEQSDIEDAGIETAPIVERQPGTLVAKDSTAWVNNLPRQGLRTAAHNVFRDTNIGPTRVTKGLTESAIFDLIFTPRMMDQILIETNDKAARAYTLWNRQNAAAPKTWKKLTTIEMRAFIGLLFMAGVHKSSDESVDVLWSTDSLCFFRAAMPLKRFRAILRFIRFDSERTRLARLATDKAAPISDLWTQMNNNLRKYYKPSGEITVDEQLFAYRGRTKFTQYIPSKPAKYGIKIWFACDANTFYPLNSEIYVGKNVGADRSVNVGEGVVERLVVHWENTGRTIVCDNFFTTLNLGRYLLSKNLALLGTVRQNKRFVPDEMKASRSRLELSSIFGFHENKFALVSYVPKKSKSVILLSTLPLTNTVVAEKKNKPQYILDYNATKGGVDTMDKMTICYTTKRSTRRWPLAMFYNMMDICGLAANIIYSENNNHIKDSTRRRKFLRSLAKQLINPAIEERMSNPRVIGHLPTRRAIEMALEYAFDAIAPGNVDAPQALPDISKDKNLKNPVRCQVCPAGKRKTTRKHCSWCKKPVCDGHATTYTLGDCCHTKKSTQ